MSKEIKITERSQIEILEHNNWHENITRGVPQIWAVKWKSENLKIGKFVIIQFGEQKDKRIKKNEQSLWDLWDTTKRANIYTLRGSQKEKGGKIRIFEELMARNLSNLIKDLKKEQFTHPRNNKF